MGTGSGLYNGPPVIVSRLRRHGLNRTDIGHMGVFRRRPLCWGARRQSRSLPEGDLPAPFGSEALGCRICCWHSIRPWALTARWGAVAHGRWGAWRPASRERRVYQEVPPPQLLDLFAWRILIRSPSYTVTVETPSPAWYPKFELSSAVEPKIEISVLL